jgi:hypothetical protein
LLENIKELINEKNTEELVNVLTSTETDTLLEIEDRNLNALRNKFKTQGFSMDKVSKTEIDLLGAEKFAKKIDSLGKAGDLLTAPYQVYDIANEMVDLLNNVNNDKKDIWIQVADESEKILDLTLNFAMKNALYGIVWTGGTYVKDLSLENIDVSMSLNDSYERRINSCWEDVNQSHMRVRKKAYSDGYNNLSKDYAVLDKEKAARKSLWEEKADLDKELHSWTGFYTGLGSLTRDNVESFYKQFDNASKSESYLYNIQKQIYDTAYRQGCEARKIMDLVQ